MLDSPLISVEQKPSQSSGEGRDGRKSTRWRLCCYLDWGSWWFSYRRTPHCWSLTGGVCETEWSTSPLLPSHPRWIWGITHRPVRWAGNCRSMKLDGAFKASNSNHDTDLCGFAVLTTIHIKREDKNPLSTTILSFHASMDKAKKMREEICQIY